MKMKRPASSAASPQSRRYFSSVRRHQRSDHPFSVGYTAAAGTFHEVPRSYPSDDSRRVPPLRLCDIYVLGTVIYRRRRRQKIKTNISAACKCHGHPLQSEVTGLNRSPPLESVLKAVCDPDGCGAERLEDRTAFTPTPGAPSDSAACCISYTVQVSYP